MHGMNAKVIQVKSGNFKAQLGKYIQHTNKNEKKIKKNKSKSNLHPKKSRAKNICIVYVRCEI